ncbi:MAG: cysteine desulfurase family protein [Gammaproteobacteria bacterium]
MIYLDHNATTPLDERVLEAMLPYLKTFYGNASSLYRQGRVVRSAIDTARDQVASLVGVSPNQVVFTSGGTEANNLALASIESKAGLAISSIEHPSIFEPARYLKSLGHDLTILAVDSNGLVETEAVERLSVQKPCLVSIMLANNETGVIQDVSAFAGLLRECKHIVHTDAVQAAGKIQVDFARLGVHLMSLSSHKIYGPKGCGALVYDNAARIKPVMLGGSQEQGLRAGTENAAAIVGFGKAAELAGTELSERNATLRVLRDTLEQRLCAVPGVSVFSREAERLPNTVQFGIDGVDGEMLLMKLDRKGIAVSSGSACSSGGKEPSPVLTAMGIEAGLGLSAIRVSLGVHNTESELCKFIEQLKMMVLH